jgi:acyl-CoA synthetase (AMP-forming)/AMP-acid ligase II
MILGKSLSESATRYPDKVAIIFEGHRWTYRQLNSRVNRLSGVLSSMGLKKNDKAAMLAKNGNEYLESYYAMAKLGIWMVPINYRLQLPEIEMRLTHSDARAIILGAEYVEKFISLSSELRKAFADRILVLGDAAPSGMNSYEGVLKNSTEAEPQIFIEPEDPLYIGYTAGTTGLSKGAIISNRSIVSGFKNKILERHFTKDDITLNPGPFWHSAPRDGASLHLYLGATTVIMREFHAEEFLSAVEKYRVTNGFIVPTMFRMLIDLPGNERYDTSSLRLLISGGAPLPVQLKEACIKRFGPILFESYASTETRVIASISPEEMSRKIRSVGRPSRDVKIRILDERGNDLSSGRVGEIYVRGPSLFSGYYKDEKKTQESYRNGWFTLGDMGRFDEEGYLYIVDRKQDMVISGGENIYPSEVEEVLRAYPKVAEAAVIGIPDEKWGEVLKAFIVLKPGETADEKEILFFCATRLADYLKPKSIEFVSELPRNPAGKILKRVLREAYWKGSEFKV